MNFIGIFLNNLIKLVRFFIFHGVVGFVIFPASISLGIILLDCITNDALNTFNAIASTIPEQFTIEQIGQLPPQIASHLEEACDLLTS